MPLASISAFVPEILSGFSFTEAWPWILASLGCTLLLSGLDDFVPVLICLSHWLFSRPVDTSLQEEVEEERRIAIFVPCWKESKVIEGMVRQNLARIRYRNFDIFLGVYPNDQPTCDAAFDVAAHFANVHVVVGPHAGPTSKADCLNSIYGGMVTFERSRQVSFDTIVLHDAEDLIHSHALEVINRKRAQYEMVQVPVLPLPTPAADFTHGIYCDEFSEFQLIDMRARQYSRSFIPSNGVGTGFARTVLEELAKERGGGIFDPSSLTEDYDIGLQIHYAGFKQLFYPLERGAGGIIATREFFPRKVSTAIRQRTRWITGIALQSWERHGWQGSWRTRYWFWRDRKGLLTNPLSLLTNIIFLAGVIDWIVSVSAHRPWAFAVANPLVVKLCVLTTCMQVFRLTLRSICVARLFGFAMALTVPLRCFHTNFVNCAASIFAVKNYISSRLRRKSLTWNKTEHAYPTRIVDEPYLADLGEVLVKSGFLSQAMLDIVRTHLPPGQNMAEFLLANRLVSESDIDRAMSLQSGLPLVNVDVQKIKREVLRSLPAYVEKQYKVLPFRVSAGCLHLASTRVPEAHVYEAVGKLTRLQVEVQLVTRINYAELLKLL
ncbi:MAG: glycosyl transferase family protein [Acidobacteriaceae bacterium]|nr:glycosyl transferase family protein [Acidobacteriaceae bacterium]